MSRQRQQAIRLLRRAYEQGGFVRIKMEHRRGGVRSGWEIRIPSQDDAPASKLLKSLNSIGLTPGAPYSKRRQMVIPIYGRDQVEAFLKMTGVELKSIVPHPPANTDLRRKNPPARKPHKSNSRRNA